jgi:hypothetical protein
MCVLLLRLVLTVAVLLPALARADEEMEKAFEKRTEWTNREAGELLRVLLSDRIEHPQPCMFASKWSTRPIDASLAQKYLGSTLHADLLAPDAGKAPAEIVDPAATMQGAFCSDADADQSWNQRQALFRSGMSPGETEKHRRHPFVRMTRTDVTMPVFDTTFTVAIVVVSHITQTVAKTDIEGAEARPRMYDSAGYRVRPDMEGFGYSLVYRKQSGQWVRIHAQQDFTIN